MFSRWIRAILMGLLRYFPPKTPHPDATPKKQEPGQRSSLAWVFALLSVAALASILICTNLTLFKPPALVTPTPTVQAPIFTATDDSVDLRATQNQISTWISATQAGNGVTPLVNVGAVSVTKLPPPSLPSTPAFGVTNVTPVPTASCPVGITTGAYLTTDGTVIQVITSSTTCIIYSGTQINNPVSSPDGRYVAFYSLSSADGILQVIDLNGNLIASANGAHPSWRNNEVLYYSLANIIYSLNITNPSSPQQLPITGRIPDTSNDGFRLVFRDANGFLQVVDSETFQVQLTIPGNNWYPAWSPDGARIAYATRDAQRRPIINVYDVAAGTVSTIYGGAQPGSEIQSIEWLDVQTLIFVDGATYSIIPGAPPRMIDGVPAGQTWVYSQP